MTDEPGFLPAAGWTPELVEDFKAAWEEFVRNNPPQVHRLRVLPQTEADAVKRAVIKATADALRYIGYMSTGAYTGDELKAMADQVATGDLDRWACCPVCGETWCDGDCPLAPVRGTDPPGFRA